MLTFFIRHRSKLQWTVFFVLFVWGVFYSWQNWGDNKPSAFVIRESNEKFEAMLVPYIRNTPPHYYDVGRVFAMFYTAYETELVDETDLPLLKEKVDLVVQKANETQPPEIDAIVSFWDSFTESAGRHFSEPDLELYRGRVTPDQFDALYALLENIDNNAPLQIQTFLHKSLKSIVRNIIRAEGAQRQFSDQLKSARNSNIMTIVGYFSSLILWAFGSVFTHSTDKRKTTKNKIKETVSSTTSQREKKS